jgi:hypothetical protein
MSTAASTVDPDTIAQAGDSPETIRDKVLYTLYYTVPGIELEDVLELRVLIDLPTNEDSHSRQAQAVLTAVQEEVETWPDPPTIHTPPSAYE